MRRLGRRTERLQRTNEVPTPRQRDWVNRSPSQAAVNPRRGSKHGQYITQLDVVREGGDADQGRQELEEDDQGQHLDQADLLVTLTPSSESSLIDYHLISLLLVASSSLEQL